MRAPTIGQHLTAADGTIWLVESVTTAAELDDEEIMAEDPDFFTVELIPLADADDMDAMGTDLTNTEFESFCKSEGINYA